MQSSTFELGVFYLGSNLFADGQAAVVLSRVKSLDNLPIKEVDSSKLTGKRPYINYDELKRV